MEPLLGIPVGLALSTAAGLRVFVPLLLTGLAARLGYLTLTPSMRWIGSDAALVAFATATVLEVGAYYVPWLDNVLDTVATPAAITAGVITTAAVTQAVVQPSQVMRRRRRTTKSFSSRGTLPKMAIWV